MVIDLIKKQRPINWLRLNRLFLNLKFKNKFTIFNFVLKVFKKIKNTQINSFFFFFLKKKNKSNIFKKNILPNVSTQVHTRCFFGGYSRGTRWSMSRLNILTKSFSGSLNNISISRW